MDKKGKGISGDEKMKFHVEGLEKKKEMLQLYQTKFSIQDVSHVLYGLTYFDDAESERMPRMLWNVKWADIKKTIQKWVANLGS
ncbi:MAG: hypothetical protein AB1649_16055 [Chloroflexota bacterium]